MFKNNEMAKLSEIAKLIGCSTEILYITRAGRLG
jgi:hypothetical protein